MTGFCGYCGQECKVVLIEEDRDFHDTPVTSVVSGCCDDIPYADRSFIEEITVRDYDRYKDGEASYYGH